jgi:hypothetical protein
LPTLTMTTSTSTENPALRQNDLDLRKMDHAAAYMGPVTSNAQSELMALEKGLHALRSGMDVKDLDLGGKAGGPKATADIDLAATPSPEWPKAGCFAFRSRTGALTRQALRPSRIPLFRRHVAATSAGVGSRSAVMATKRARSSVMATIRLSTRGKSARSVLTHSTSPPAQSACHGVARADC